MASTTANTESSSFKQDIRDLGDGVGVIKDDVKHLAGSAMSAARHGATELKQTAHDVADTAKEKLTHAKDAAVEATESMKACVSRNPLTSLVIATAVGLVIGVLVLRRK
jgi:ElaB/YqjD/DUF883 family membrane-anchored ribosome-binding protein